VNSLTFAKNGRSNIAFTEATVLKTTEAAASVASNVATALVAVRRVANLRTAISGYFTFSVGGSAGLDEALVETEVVPDAVAPRRRGRVVAVRQPARQHLVDVGQNQSLLGRRQDRHRDERDVRLLLRRFPAGGKVGPRQVRAVT